MRCGREQRELQLLTPHQTLTLAPTDTQADPYMRGGLKMPLDGGKPRTMAGYVSGRVLESAVSDWAAGDLFGASLPYADVQAISADRLAKTQIWKLTGLIDEVDISHGIGAMGMPGATGKISPHRTFQSKFATLH